MMSEDTPPHARQRANSLTTLSPSSSNSGRRSRAGTQLSPIAVASGELTPRNRARVQAHLRLVGSQTIPTETHESEESSSSGSDSSSSSSASPPIDFITPLANLNQAEVDERLEEGVRVDAAELRKRSARRVQSETFDIVPHEHDGAIRAIGVALAPMNINGDDDDTETVEDDRLASDTSPRSDAPPQRGKKQRTTRIMQGFLSGDDCEYSWRELHECVASGLSDTLREQFWAMQCVSSETVLPAFDLVMTQAKLPVKVYNQIMTDLYRTDEAEARGNRTFINTLYRCLVVHAALRPDIGYVQGMNHIWGVIIACVSKPQVQLYVAEYLVRTVLPQYFTTDEIVGAAVDAVVMRHYLRRRCPNIHTLLCEKFGTDSLHPMLVCITTSWFTCLYSTRLQTSQVKRLWDLIMLRGAVVLFEFTLRLFIFAYKQKWLKNAPNWPEFILMLDEKLMAMSNIDPIINTHLPMDHLVAEDFASRRRAATRVVFAALNDSVSIVNAGEN
jgi:hypothetical protein